MDTKKISALLTIVSSGSLTSAADTLGYTQPGLTNMMKSLEDEIGLTLLVRSKSGVALTAEGRALLDSMNNLLKSAEALDKNIERLKMKNFSELRVGAYASVAKHWLPSILADYRSSSPGTNMYISMQDIRETYDAVKNGSLDCAIVSYQKSLMSGLSWTPLKNDELVAILPGSWSEEEGPFPVEYFADMEFLMPSGGFEMDIAPIFDAGGIKNLPNFRYHNLEDSAIVSMVAHGLGVSILSRLVMKGINENVSVVPLSPRADRQLGIIVRSKRSSDKSIKHFVSSARKTLEQI